MRNSQQTTFDLNGPILSFATQPQPTSILSSDTYSGTVSSLIVTTYNNYPVRGYLYYPTSSNIGTSVDVVVLYHGTITDQGVSPADAALTFLSIALNRINLKDKLIFSVAYPQDAIPLWEANPSLPAQQFPGLNYPTFYLGDNIAYAEAALLWVKNSLNSYLSSNSISKTINRVFTFGHSQGAYLVHRLNTMQTVDGVISNAPGPIDLLNRCSGVENTTNLTCNKIKVGFGTTTANPSAYNTRSLKSYLSGTLSPTLFTQALDDTTGNSFGSPQVSNMQNIVQVGLSTCTNCSTSTFNYYATGGHDAFVTNTYLQRDIRNFVGAVGAGIATFIGIATATFTTGVSSGSPTAPSNPASNTGIITYRWYEEGVGALSDSTYVTGTATTTLTFSRLITPTDNQRRFYLEADYIPSAYQTSSPVTAGTARSTGNAINEPLSSSVGILTVFPLIEIIAQPTDIGIATNSTAVFTINAGLTDSFFADDLVYQWHYNGSPITDGTISDFLTTTTIIPGVGGVTQNRSDTVTFNNPGSISLPSTSNNVRITVAGGRGGNGGADAGAGGGSGTGGRFGQMVYSNGGRTLTFTIGKRGNDGASNSRGGGGGRGGDGLNRGGDGGNAGPTGSSGGGGGGGGSTGVYDSQFGDYTIIASGGGGGGGASLNVPGAPAWPDSGGFEPNGQNRSDGANGENASGDGGGGGGGGAGTNNSPHPTGSIRPRQLGGRSGLDSDKGNRQALGGGGGAPDRFSGGHTFGGFNRSAASFAFNGSQNDGEGYAQVSYNWSEFVPNPTVTVLTSSPRNITFSGSRTASLSIVSDNVVGLATIFCKITSATAINSPVSSDIVEYKVVSSAENYFVNLEQIGSTNTAALNIINLQNGEYTINQPAATANISQIVFYAPDRNINIEMDLYGGKGTSSGSIQGGEGGFSRIRFTMAQNTEYVIAGLTNNVGTPFVYRKGQLIACVGKGGNAGTSGRGGFGGGIRIAGNAGSGRDAGVGGALIAAGNLGGDGIFGSLTSLVPTTPDTKATAPNGGRVLKCTKGIYWKDQGVSACADVGTGKFRLSDGVEVTNTASIARGYKAGYDIIQTAGRGSNNGGAGGNGATGGAGGQNGSGGGGGSGYTDGSVTVVNSQLGGSTGEAKVVIRLIS